jgi:hypothetical protein
MPLGELHVLKLASIQTFFLPLQPVRLNGLFDSIIKHVKPKFAAICPFAACT